MNFPAETGSDSSAGKRIRVLALSDHLGYPDGRSHGGTTYFTTVFPELAKEGIALKACFIGPPHPASKHLEERGVETFFLNRGKYDPRVFTDVDRIIRREKIQVLHLASYRSHFAGRILARLRGIGSIVHIHDSVKLPFFVRVLQLLVSRATDRAIAVSRPMTAHAVSAYGIPAGRVSVLHNAVDTERFRKAAEAGGGSFLSESGISPEKKLLAVIGRLDSIKGQKYAVRAMEIVSREDGDALLLVVGDGGKRAEYENLVEKLGLGNSVIFTGHRDDMPRLLSAVKIVLVTSLHTEGGPFTAMEAAAAGKPVVIYDIADGSGVVIDGFNGITVPAGDVAALAGAVVSLLKDGRLYAKMSERALSRSEAFSVERHAGKLADFYRSMV